MAHNVHNCAHHYNFDRAFPATQFDIGMSHGSRACVDNEIQRCGILKRTRRTRTRSTITKNNDENNEEDKYEKEREEMQAMIIYNMENKAIGMMQKVNIKIPSPTQFDKRYPQFYEWAGEVKVYFSVHDVNIEDIMDDGTKSVTVILLGDIQDEYTANEGKFSVALQEGENDYDEYMDMTINIKKMRRDIVNFSQTLNYVLLHVTKPGSEAHSVIRRVMRQSNGLESWRQLQLLFAGGHQYHKWLEDINRYESEHGQGTANDHVKIATVVNNIKGNIAHNLMMKINQRTTFDERNSWWSKQLDENYNDDVYEGEEDENWDYDNDDKITIAFMKGKAKGHKKGKDKGKKGDNGNGKDGKTTVTCYTCGRQGQALTTCYYNPKGKHGKGQSKKAINNNPTTNNQAIHNNSLPINSNTTVNHHHNLHNTTKATTKAMENNGAVVTTKVERRDKFQFNRSTTVTTPTTTMKRTHPLGTLPTIRSGFQRQTTLNYCQDKKFINNKFFNNNNQVP
eukprot:6223849-Amphidinium_carterae.2